MLGKRFALLGSTCTGKSTSAALILYRIVELAPQGDVVMIDPHGEYSAAFKGDGALFDVSNLQLPYWLMNFEEHCEVFLTTQGSERQVDADILAKCLLAARAKSRQGQEIPKLTVDAPVPYLLSDLTNLIQLEMGKMDKASNAAPYLRVKSKIDEIKGDPRYGFMFSGMLVADTMAAFIQRIFRLPGDGKPISIVDVSGVPSEITSVVVAVLSRMTFDFVIWSRNEPQRPILLVCEEAHRYIPAASEQHSSVGRILGRIAKEGRKYDVSLGLITSARPTWRKACCRSAAPSRCGSTTTAIRPSSARRCRKARGGFSIRSRRSGTASASSAARASPSRSASRSTGWSRRSARRPPTRSSRTCGARWGARRTSSAGPSRNGAPRGGKAGVARGRSH